MKLGALSMAALLARAVWAQTPAPAGGVNFYSLEKEQALGAQLASEYRRTASVIESPPVTEYLNRLGRRLAARVPGAALTYSFEPVDDDRAFPHEPVTFPGGHVFVPASLILAARNEDELAGMLAHSIAHIAARHGTREAAGGPLANQAAIPLIYMGGWQGNAVPLGFVKLQRRSELEADALAAQTMAAAGYNPAALIDSIERLQPPDRDARLVALRAGIVNLRAATHPEQDGFPAIQEEVRRLTAKPAKAPPRLAR
jgi:predicted Zn-dependent protease